MTFTKLFSSITESTVWMESDHTRLVWIAMLAMADRHGRVWASAPGLANRARVPLESCEAALRCFLEPDAYSRTKAHEGRRIEVIDGGWRLLNHEKYRAIRDEESIKESKRKYINERRRKERVDKSTSTVEPSRHNAEADTEADTEAKSEAEASKTIGKRSAVASPASDAELIASLSANPTYAGIDVPREHGKMLAWCSVNRKVPTRRLFINWLNRADRPMGAVALRDEEYEKQKKALGHEF